MQWKHAQGKRPLWKSTGTRSLAHHTGRLSVVGGDRAPEHCRRNHRLWTLPPGTPPDQPRNQLLQNTPWLVRGGGGTATAIAAEKRV